MRRISAAASSPRGRASEGPSARTSLTPAPCTPVQQGEERKKVDVVVVVRGVRAWVGGWVGGVWVGVWVNPSQSHGKHRAHIQYSPQ